MVDINSIASGAKSIGYNVAVGGGIMLVLGFIIFMGYLWIRDKKLYKYPVTALILKESGSFKEINNLRGGIVQLNNGISDFQVKIAGFKKRNIGFLPDLRFSDSDDRVTFIVSSDGKTWQQVKKSLVSEKEKIIIVEDEKGNQVEKKITANLIIEPIPIDVKATTINNIHAIDNILDKNRMSAMKIGIGAVVLVVFLQILFLFLTSK